ncbi:MAG: hypothetical protein AB8B91_09430 [Rubripirellula sp.]
MKPSSGLLVVVVLFFAFGRESAFSQPPIETSAADSVDQATARLYQQYSETAESLALETVSGDAFRLEPQPLFRFATNGSTFGSVFIWRDAESRLAVIGTIGSLPIRQLDHEFVELHLLKPAAINAVALPGSPPKQWTPDVAALKLMRMENTPLVAANARSRMVQMRGIARQFTAMMQYNGQRQSLRLLPQPLFRYADSTQEKDGALFAFVWDTGTDPELLLRLEALQVGQEIHWHYQPVRFTYRELALSRNDDQVWSVEEFVQRDAPQQTTPYVTGLTKIIP